MSVLRDILPNSIANEVILQHNMTNTPPCQGIKNQPVLLERGISPSVVQDRYHAAGEECSVLLARFWASFLVNWSSGIPSWVITRHAAPACVQAS